MRRSKLTLNGNSKKQNCEEVGLRNEGRHLLHHLNRVRLTINFTVAQEEDGTLPFLDTLLRRREDGSLDISACLEEAHAYEPVSPLRVPSSDPCEERCRESLHDKAREIISMQDKFQKKVDHLIRVLKQNGYPAKFIRNASALPTEEIVHTCSCDEEQEEEKGPLVVIPYVAGMREDIRHFCREFNIKAVTLRSMLTRVKDTLPLGKQSNVVYHMPCSCS